MGTKPCSICTRVMALEQFRAYTSGERAGKHRPQCRQCEAGDKAIRRVEVLSHRPTPLCRVMREWGAPVSPAPLLYCLSTPGR